MATRTEVPVSIHSRNNHDLPQAQGMLKVVEWTARERFKNSVKTFGTFFALTCFAVIMPVIHYILVPVLMITTFVMALEKYSQLRFIEGGTGSCPKCGESIELEKSKYKERLTDSCAKCHEDVEVLMNSKSS